MMPTERTAPRPLVLPKTTRTCARSLRIMTAVGRPFWGDTLRMNNTGSGEETVNRRLHALVPDLCVL